MCWENDLDGTLTPLAMILSPIMERVMSPVREGLEVVMIEELVDAAPVYGSAEAYAK